MKLRLVRLNPLTLEPGEFFVVCGRDLGAPNFSQFPARLEACERQYAGEDVWYPVEYVNEFLTNEDNDAREVRVEVQVPVYSPSSRNKRGGGDKGGGSAQVSGDEPPDGGSAPP